MPKFLSAVHGLRDELPKFDAVADGYKIKIESIEKVSGAITYQKTRELQDAQRLVIERVAGFCCGRLVERDPAGNDARARIGENSPVGRALERSGYAEDGAEDHQLSEDEQLFGPHNTTNWVKNDGHPFALPRDFSNENIARDYSGTYGPPLAYTLGPHGQCVQRLNDLTPVCL